MMEQACTDAASLRSRCDVRVSHQHYISFVLDSHHAKYAAVLLRDPENHACIDLSSQLTRRHVGFVPAISRYHSPICVRSVVDYGEDRVKIRRYTFSNDNHVLVDERYQPLSRRHEFLIRRSNCCHQHALFDGNAIAVDCDRTGDHEQRRSPAAKGNSNPAHH